MNEFLRKTLIYCMAIAVGYSACLLFLGDQGKELLGTAVPDDVTARKNFIVNVLSTGPSPADLLHFGNAQYAGEWTIGTYAMATYALTNIAMAQPQTPEESSRIIAKWIEYSCNKSIFNFDEAAWLQKPLDEEVLNSDYGHIGYYGHVNLMLGCYALLNNDGRFHDLHAKVSEAIARRMRKYPHRHVETYPQETYPPDNTVAAASLRVADMTIRTNYKELVDEWVEESKKIEYPPYGLIVFQIDINTGKPLQSSRGSNIGWNSFFLPLVDEEYARLQFERLKKHMLFRLPGIAAFREYPEGGWFVMDRDTGPVILGLGGTATAFSVAGARRSKDEALLTGLLRPLELFGVSASKDGQKRYLVLPVVADAIMLAMKTACKWRPLWKEAN
jgi:hypothetical protein